MRIAALVALVLAIASPAFAFKCPARGGTEWREYRTDHFAIDTDLSRPNAELLFRQLEQVRALLLYALVNEPIEIPGHLRVVAFADPRDFREMAGRNDTGVYYTSGLLAEPTVVIPVEGMTARPELIAHELAHHLSRYLFPVQPHWFSEGLAAFVESVAAPKRNSVGAVGVLPQKFESWQQVDPRPVKTAELLAWNGVEDSAGTGRYHLWSWVLYHYLWNSRGKQLSDYQKRLADTADPDAAWKGAFPDLNPANAAALDALDKALEKYAKDARYAFYSVEADVSARATVRGISSSDVHLLLRNARANSDESKRKARDAADVAEAAEEDPDSALAQWLQRGDAFKEEDARAAAARRPEDWRSWYVLSTRAKGAARIEALRKATALNGENAMLFNNLAWELAVGGQAREALAPANRSLDLMPWRASLVDTMAEVAARLGKCQEAAQLARRAQRQNGDDEQSRARTAEIQARCQAAK